MVSIGETREKARDAGTPLVAGGFRWSTVVQRLRETNRRSSRGMLANGSRDEPPVAVLWGEYEKSKSSV